MDWTLFHALNEQLAGRPTLDRAVSDFATWSVPVFAAATVLLWIWPRLRLACASALAAAGIGLLVNQLIGRIWFRERPYAAHPGAVTVLAHRSRDPSFPSDHATAAFAIAFAVLVFSRPLGAAFLAAAAAIGVSRVLVGLHYPGDVAAGAAIGLASALVAAYALRGPLSLVTAYAGRATDPVLTRLRLPP